MKIHTTISQIRRTVLPFGLVFCLVISLIPSRLAFAEDNRLYFTPAASQMNTNTIFTVNVRAYADADQPNGVAGTANGTVTYPTSQLQVIENPSTSGSNYGSLQISQGSGTIKFSGTRKPNAPQTYVPSGNAQLFSITFKSIGAGNAVVGFTSDSKVNGATTSYSVAGYTIINPNPPTPTPAPSSTKPKPGTAPKPTPVPIVSAPEPTIAPVDNSDTDVTQTTPDPTGVVDGVSASTHYTTATITWKVNAENPTSTLIYGRNTSQLDKKAIATKKPDGTFSADISGLTPGVRYMFTIAAEGTGEKSGNFTGTFLTNGYPVTISVTENSQPVEGGQIKIGSQSVYIKTSGKVTLGLAAGAYAGSITTDTATLSINLTVEAKPVPADGSAPETQGFGPYNLTSSVLEQGPGSGTSILTFVGVLLGGSVLLGIGFVGFMAYRRRKFESADDNAYTTNNSSSVVIDDGYNWRSEPQSNEVNALPPAEPLIAQPQAPVAPRQHNNSVYLPEEEPLDMFEQAEHKLPLPPSNYPSPLSPDGTAQSPNSPHSTKT